ncbi:neprilysin-2-like [Aphidius gifuensis]|uniref:neprilysin-2-like n=1 Tax=Aphidius gifuensis TaxID=684658 RepID=UPI001CDCD390|nr:neprilysin-2-like [Aphidius gifuensis]
MVITQKMENICPQTCFDQLPFKKRKYVRERNFGKPLSTITNILNNKTDNDIPVKIKMQNTVELQYLTSFQRETVKNNEDICLSPACIHAASRMLNNMDSKVSPCDNFYKYSCGNFIKSTQLADSVHSQDSYSQSEHKLKNELRSIINLPNFPNDTKPLRIAKDFYQTCLNTSAINKQGLDEIKKIINNTGGWPVLDGNKWNETSFDWVETTYKLSKLGYTANYLISVELDNTVVNSKFNAIHLTQPKLLNVSNIDALKYVEFMYDVAVMFGANPRSIFKDMLQTLEFANEIVKISNKKSRKNSILMSIYGLNENKALPINWNEYINLVFGSNDTLSDETFVVVETPMYFDKLGLLLNKTSNRIIANYIMWNVVEESIVYLSDEIRKISTKYIRIDTENNVLYNYRDTHCFNMVYNKLPSIMDTIYFTNIFNKNIKNIPAGILGDFFFNNDYPNYVNYGNVGFIIAHEFTHGFVIANRLFQETSKTDDSFVNKTKCFIEQYDNYTIEEIQEKANGLGTLDENMADIGGVKLSYLAYKELSKEHGPEQKLPGFESFTSEQMFWLSSANAWCSKVRPEILSKIKNNDSHSLPEHLVHE